MKMSIKLEGADELVRQLHRRGVSVSQARRSALGAGGEIVREAMARNAPRRRGELAESIEVGGYEETKSRASIHIYPRAFWGLYQEKGTRYHAAQPFVRPAIDENEGPVQQAISRDLRRAIE